MEQRKEIINALMVKVDELKNKITNNQYLELCNIIKELYDDSNDSDSDDENTFYIIEDLIGGFVVCLNENQTRMPDINPLRTFNRLIGNVCRNQINDEFVCLCGVRVVGSSFHHHILSQEHITNFRVPKIEEYHGIPPNFR